MWEHRNEVLHDEKSMNPEQLLVRIKHTASRLVEQHHVSVPDSKNELHWLEVVGYKEKQLQKKGTWVKWALGLGC